MRWLIWVNAAEFYFRETQGEVVKKIEELKLGTGFRVCVYEMRNIIEPKKPASNPKIRGVG